MNNSLGTFSLFGASKVGVSLSFNLYKSGYYPKFLWNRSENRLLNALKYVPFNTYSTDMNKFQLKTEWIIISVSDDAIEKVAESIAKLPENFANVKIFHTSGCFGSTVLQSLKEKGARVGSLHPVLSVSGIKSGIENLPTAIFICEGEIQSELIKLVRKFGGTGIALDSNQKKVIHISATFLNNYIVVLIEAVKRLCKDNGLSEEKTGQILRNLSEQSIKQGWNYKISEILTGPLIRGDVKTIKEHLNHLEKTPNLKHLYIDFAKLALKMLNLSEDLYKSIC